MIYVDTSALAKLLLSEAGSLSMLEIAVDSMVTSAITTTELRRTVRRFGPHLAVECESLLARVTTLAVDVQLLRAASTVDPVTLRSLDAIHLASAMSVRDEIDLFVAYDHRLLDAAHLAGIPTASPGV